LFPLLSTMPQPACLKPGSSPMILIACAVIAEASGAASGELPGLHMSRRTG
jgi:hypothetical protein